MLRKLCNSDPILLTSNNIILFIDRDRLLVHEIVIMRFYASNPIIRIPAIIVFETLQLEIKTRPLIIYNL